MECDFSNSELWKTLTCLKTDNYGFCFDNVMCIQPTDGTKKMEQKNSNNQWNIMKQQI